MKDKIIQANKIQKEASDINYCVHLSASAGTGKTKTLIDRIIQLLLNQYKFKEILCITYTNLSADEILFRLGNKLKEIEYMSMDQRLIYLKSQINESLTQDIIFLSQNLYRDFLSNYEKIRIQTVHSFCNEILNKSAQIKGHDPGIIQIIDQSQKYKLIQRALESTILDSKNNTALSKSIDHISLKYDYKFLLQMLVNILSEKEKLYIFMSYSSTISDLIYNQYKIYGCEKHFQSNDELCNDIVENNMSLQSFIQNHQLDNISNLSFIAKWQSSDIEYKRNYQDKYIQFFLKKNLQARKKISVHCKILKKYPKLHELLILEQKRIEDSTHQKTNLRQSIFTKNMLIFINHASNEYEKLKNKLNGLDFDDLIIRCIELFDENNDIENFMFSLDKSVLHLLIDESQDLSKMQWLVIHNIITGMKYNNSSIFIVGDYKQSIYSFQGANPNLFLNSRKECERLHNVKKPWKSLELHYSFRSNQTILDAVDLVFHNSMYFEDKHISLRDNAGKVSVVKCEQDKKEGGSLSDNHVSQEFYIKQITHFIVNMIKSRDDLKAHDIMVLFKKRGTKMKALIDQLNDHNIPVDQMDRIDLSNDVVFLDLLSVLKFIMLRNDDLNLASLLKSTFIMLNDSQIHELIIKKQDLPLWVYLKNIQHESTKFLFEVINVWENKSLYDFYSYLLFKKQFIVDFYSYFGSSCKKTIYLFLEKIVEFSNQFKQGGNCFIDWIQNASIFSIAEYDNDAIRIITSHASKGLESKVVILADPGDSENTPSEDFFWIDNKLIIPYDISKYCNKVNEYKKERKKLLQEENLRLLYVSMTRAQNELYIFEAKDSNKNSWVFKIKDVLPKQESNLERVSYAPLSKKILEFSNHKISLPKYPDLNQTPLSKKDSSNKNIKKGVFIHRLLVDMVFLDKVHWLNYGLNLARQSFQDINNKDVLEIIEIAKQVFVKFPRYFNNKNFFEISMKQGKSVVRLDVLSIEDSVSILDIKTDQEQNLRQNNIPHSYKTQLYNYKKYLKGLYPNKLIKCLILSFYQQCIIEV